MNTTIHGFGVSFAVFSFGQTSVEGRVLAGSLWALVRSEPLTPAPACPGL